MLLILLIILILLWIVGYVQLPFIPNTSLFVLFGRSITLWDLIIFFVLLGIITILPRPFREIAGILFVLWLLSLLGVALFIPFGGWFLLALIVLLVVSLVF